MLASLAGAVLLTLSLPAAAAPSFDCAKARTKVEKGICASPALSALDQRLAAAYAKAMARLDPAGQRALKADQRIFLDVRDRFFGTPDYDLKSDLAERAAWLERIDPSATKGWDGTWGSVMGEITLSKGGAAADINTVALTQGHPTCTLEVAAIVDGDTLLVGGAPADLKENDGWSVRLARSGTALTAELLPPKASDSAGGPPFCGNIPSIGGAFLPLRALPDEPAPKK
ncbi:lysozyme inhibitor LprI family protein [Aquabacter cavernae]|uniref:lysozyme inhibitor LprI family protein n=1 Tax=Aquabacter cavernae TaxID=2496029 RepID=UPI0013DFFE2B|nr:lysozyme inhibitor LprI family protein [Aquabacter cavernae]